MTIDDFLEELKGEKLIVDSVGCIRTPEGRCPILQVYFKKTGVVLYFNSNFLIIGCYLGLNIRDICMITLAADTTNSNELRKRLMEMTNENHFFRS